MPNKRKLDKDTPGEQNKRVYQNPMVNQSTSSYISQNSGTITSNPFLTLDKSSSTSSYVTKPMKLDTILKEPEPSTSVIDLTSNSSEDSSESGSENGSENASNSLEIPDEDVDKSVFDERSLEELLALRATIKKDLLELELCYTPTEVLTKNICVEIKKTIKDLKYKIRTKRAQEIFTYIMERDYEEKPPHNTTAYQRHYTEINRALVRNIFYLPYIPPDFPKREALKKRVYSTLIRNKKQIQANALNDARRKQARIEAKANKNNQKINQQASISFDNPQMHNNLTIPTLYIKDADLNPIMNRQVTFIGGLPLIPLQSEDLEYIKSLTSNASISNQITTLSSTVHKK